MSWRNRPFDFLSCHWDIVLFSMRNLAIFEIFDVMEKSYICDGEINMHCVEFGTFQWISGSYSFVST